MTIILIEIILLILITLFFIATVVMHVNQIKKGKKEGESVLDVCIIVTVILIITLLCIRLFT
ncbi:hypothetical protein BK821_08815 [Staphylococcus sp. LCT-H4]|nr:hypothetical protein BK821_08815 [Staphylococcus sp. LCT-H4]PNZ13779.1 hypothetical protein CD109_13735 [Staphylococcus succinus subsp. succinus]